MVLVIDLGNTSVVFGLFRGRRLLREWRVPTRKFKIPKIRAKVKRVMVASVVPSLNRKLGRMIRKQFKCNPFFVTAGNIPGLKVRLKNKREIGADRVVDALAAFTLYIGPLVVVDFGTATTFDAISARGEYLGGAIAPGIALARDALYEQAAKLPKIKISAPKQIIGKSTVSAMRSGLVYGYVAMVEGMVSRMKSEILNPKSETNPKSKIQNSKRGIKVIATGGLAKLICKYTKVVDRIDAKLTLKGLQMIGEKIYGRRT
jgi:type III pantothenate kinase